jgi:hypothetical protein
LTPGQVARHQPAGNTAGAAQSPFRLTTYTYFLAFNGNVALTGNTIFQSASQRMRGMTSTGVFQFTDSQATNRVERFSRAVSP